MTDLFHRVIWTVLPRGVVHGRAHLTAIASIRLLAEPGDPGGLTLHDFPAFLDWPKAAEGAEFHVFVDGVERETFREPEPLAEEDAAAGAPSDWWAALFGPKTPVVGHAVDDLTGAAIHSYDPAALETALSAFYGDNAARLQSSAKPTLGALGRRLVGKDAGFFFDNGAALLPLDSYLKAARPDQTQPQLPSTDPAEVAAKFDFHARLSAVSQHAAMLKRLRLAVPLSIAAHDATGADVQVRVDWSAAGGLGASLPDGAPRTAITPRFHPRSAAGLLSDGFLDPDKAGLVVVQTDVEGGVRKLEGLLASSQTSAGAESGQNQEALAFNSAEAPTNQPAGLPALRSQGFMLGFRDQAARLKGAFAQALSLDAAFKPPTAAADGSHLLFHAEDLTRGFRVDVLDEDAPVHEWRSLHWRREAFAVHGRTLTVKAAEGLVRGALAQQGIGKDKKPEMTANPALAVWTGWSLSAPYPARHVGVEDAGPPVTLPDGTTSPTSAELAYAENPPVEGLNLSTDFSHARKLPSLRYGRRYRFRVRAVDLAGGSWTEEAVTPHAMGGDVMKALRHTVPSTKEQTFHRFDPVEAPVLAFVGAGDAVDGPEAGESMGRMAIRTLDGAGAGAEGWTSRRMIFPPRVAFDQAERLGDLDDPATHRIDPAKVEILRQKDGPGSSLPSRPVALEYLRDASGRHPNPAANSPEQRVADPDESEVPYLSDSMASTLSLRFEPVRANAGGPTFIYTLDGVWPRKHGFLVELVEGSDPPHFVPGAKPETLRISLPAGEAMRLHMSAPMSDEQLKLMGVWQWALAAGGDHSDALSLAHSGLHWMLTSTRTVDLVHAVQRPLTAPTFEPRTGPVPPATHVTLRREAGAREVTVGFDTRLNLNSTRHLDVYAAWTDPLDDPAKGAPSVVSQSAHAFVRPVVDADFGALASTQIAGAPRSTRILPVSESQLLPDTRARFLSYSSCATSRFREYMPPAVRAAPEDGPKGVLAVASDQPAGGWAPASVRPPPPQIVSVVPTFGWSPEEPASGHARLRRGGGLRIYLERPWFASGFNEMLAVCFLFPAPGPDSLLTPDDQAHLTTQWGYDPLYFGGGTLATPETMKLPRAIFRHKFAGLKRPAFFETDIGKPYAGAFDALPDRIFRAAVTVPGRPELLLAVAPHLVDWDPERGLWFCDVEMDLGDAYAPFVRLALARYQPMALARTQASGSAPPPAGHWADGVGIDPSAATQLEDLHLSQVVTTDFIQLLPDRMATVLRPSGEDGVIEVRIFGHAYPSFPDGAPPTFEVLVEGLVPGADPTLERLAIDFSVEDIPAGGGFSKMGGLNLGGPSLGAGALEEQIGKSSIGKAEGPPPATEALPDLPQLFAARVRLKTKKAQVRVSVLEYETHRIESDGSLDTAPPAGAPDRRRRLVYFDEFDV
jgi:hypothetical protein